jgi:hypothetical protein
MAKVPVKESKRKIEMNETDFKLKLKEKIEEKLDGFYVKTDENLLYKVLVNDKLEYEPNNPKNPTRGNYAFQTDILIGKGITPLVVIETKYGGFSTHDILTYSTKALKHKEIYPYLRYGLVVGGDDVIHGRFFTHNVGFDFAITIKDINDENRIMNLIDIINKQIQNSNLLLDIQSEKYKIRKYNTLLVIEQYP